MKKVRWGVLGNAFIARDFMIPALENSNICELAAVASRSVFQAHIAPGAKHYDSYEALLGDPDIDVIYVPVPNALHKDWTIQALQAGKHVLCEKPLACTAQEGREMAAAAEENGRLLAEAFMYRFGAKFKKMMEIVRSGVLGEIRAMEGIHGYTLDWASPAREDPRLGGGCLYDVGCYVIDCMNAVMDVFGAKAVDCSAAFRDKGGVDWHASGWIRYDNGVIGSLQSWFDAAQEQRFLIAGEKGTLIVPHIFEGNCGELILTLGGETQVIPVENIDPYQLEAEAFSRAVLGMDDERMPIRESIRELEVLDMMYGV